MSDDFQDDELTADTVSVTENTETGVDPEAEQASSPDETDGGSSSDPAESDKGTAEAIRDEFLKKYGEPETDPEADTPEAKDGDTDEDDPERDKASESKDSNDDDGEDEKFRISDKDFKALPENVRNRLGHLNTRAKRAERKATEYEAELEATRVSHERMNELETFVRENRIETENMSKAFKMMAQLSKGDYQGFLTEISPFLQMAQQASGEVIADDLVAQVEDGAISEQAARDLTRQRAQAQRLEAENRRLQQESAAQVEQQNAAASQSQIVNAVASRERHYSSTDPDYALKREAIGNFVKTVLSNGGIPKSAEQAARIVDDAHAFVSQTFRRPEPRTATPRRPNATTPSRGRREPVTTKDVITDALLEGMPAQA